MDALEWLTQPKAPEDATGPLRALWHCARGEWDRAHILVQDDESQDAAWVHAHLHRVEGDLDNAGYWYRRAGKSVTRTSLEEERAALTAALLPR